jgi:hypothetical protein
LGQGEISFSYSPNHLRFYTRWEIQPFVENRGIICRRHVEIIGVKEPTESVLTIMPIDDILFQLQMESESLGNWKGDGHIDGESIRWGCIDDQENFGIEKFTRQEDGSYLFHAEYASAALRTIVSGHLWRKN